MELLFPDKKRWKIFLKTTLKGCNINNPGEGGTTLPGVKMPRNSALLFEILNL